MASGGSSLRYVDSMSRDIIDDRLVGALHIRAMDRAAFALDGAIDHVAFQAGTLNALMDGHFGGDATIGEVLEHGALGIGTVEHLAGELVIIDGEAFLVDGFGVVTRVPLDTPTPFAVVSQFSPIASVHLRGPLGLGDVHDRLRVLAPAPSVLALRIDGEFADIRLRSVHAQQRPYPPLASVVEHQTEWTIESSAGSVVGFRFTDRAAGIEVPGFHHHFISNDRTAGGHVLDLTVLDAVASVDGGDELHVELPPHIQLGEPGMADRRAIRTLEEG
jgi:alpha-acetolactate decarboxylase